MLFASSALRFVRRTKLVTQQSDGRSGCQNDIREPAESGKDLHNPFSNFNCELGLVPTNRQRAIVKAAFVPTGEGVGQGLGRGALPRDRRCTSQNLLSESCHLASVMTGGSVFIFVKTCDASRAGARPN